MAYLGGLLGNFSGANSFGDQLRQNFRGENPIFNLTMGLLSQLGPSTTPISPLQRLGRAGVYASEAQQQALENQARREQLTAAQQEREGITKLQEWVKANPNADDTALMNAATQFMPEVAIKSRLGNILSPQDKLQMMNIQAQLLKTQQDIGINQAQTTTPAYSVAQSVNTLADTFDAVEKGDNPFAPGKMFYKEAPLGKLGITADTVLGLPDALLRQWGDPDTIRTQAQQAQLIDKETATISRNLQTLAQTAGGGRSATAIEQMQTSLGEGNIGIPVRRKVIASTLDTIIQDMDSKGLDVPQEWRALKARLDEQTKNVGKTVTPKETTVGYSPEQGITQQPPTQTTTEAQPGVPPLALPPSGVAPGGPLRQFYDYLFPEAPSGIAAPAAPPAPPAAPPAAPPIKGVKTSEFGMGTDGKPAPIYRDPKQAEAALTELKRKGITEVIVIDPATGTQYQLQVE